MLNLTGNIGIMDDVTINKVGKISKIINNPYFMAFIAFTLHFQILYFYAILTSKRM